MSITIGNGKGITAIGQGSISLHSTTGTIRLTHVLYVPEIGSNLISVASIVDQGFKVEFTRTGCVVSKHGIENAIGNRQGNVYFLSGLQETVLAGLTQSKYRTTKEIWHQCIGHRSLNLQAIENIKKSVIGFKVLPSTQTTEQLCEVCAQGKQSRGYLTGKREKFDEILETIHRDICGPMPCVGLMGEKYYTTFIDERSGRTTIALLKQKSEVFERFKEYKAKVKRETGKRIKNLRCDGGGEYTGHVFWRYLQEEGITQQDTPPYTPEHNSIAERANRTIMEMVRCMLFDSGLGQELWGYVALTAVHIIN